MPVADQFADFATSSIAGGVGGAGTALGTTDTTLLLNTGDGAKFPASGPFMVLIGSPSSGSHELVKCTARSNDQLTIVRAQEGTGASSWPVGTPLQEVVTAGNMTNLWNQLTQLSFNVKLYGATGNGLTDDTAAIQAAINDAQTAGGGVVYFPQGIYITSAALSVTADNVILRGAGWNSVIQPISGANFDIIATGIPTTIGASGYIRNYLGIEQLQLNGSNMSGTTLGQGNGIHWYGVRYSYIDRVYFNGIKNWAALLEGDNASPGNNFGYDNVISRCKFNLCAANILFDNCEGNDVVDCRIDYALAATNASQGAFGARGTYANHIYLNSGYNYVAGNVIGKGGTYTTPAIYATNSGPCRIIGNRFDQVRNQAAVLNAGNHEFAFNAVGSPGSAGTGVPAIQLGSNNNRVVGNSFDVTAGAMSASYALIESGGPFSNNIIADNDFLPGTIGVMKLAAGSFDRVHHNAGINPPVYNVMEFGATGNGVTDDGPALRQVISVASSVSPNGFTLYFPTGTYLLNSVVTGVNNSSISSAMFLPGGCKVQGEGVNNTILRFGSSMPNQATMFSNVHCASPGGDKNIGLYDLTLDGNAANQNAATTDAQSGTHFQWMSQLNVERVQAHDFFGSTSGGNGPHGTQGEAFFLWVELSTDATFRGCEVYATSQSTSTGFQADAATGITYTDCFAHGLGIGHGFAHNNCAHVYHINCRSYSNHGYGFNSEISRDVAYTNCAAGYLTAYNVTYPFAQQSMVGNYSGGFIINGATGGVSIVGSHGMANGGDGVAIIDTISNYAGTNGHVTIEGGEFSYNGSYGIDTTTVRADWLDIRGTPLYAWNGISPVNTSLGHYNPQGVLPVPPIPPSGAPLFTPFPHATGVYISGGNVVSIFVNSASLGITAGQVFVPAGGQITLNYNTAPTWVWTAA